MADLSMPACSGGTTHPAIERTDLAVAIELGHRMLATPNDVGVREALRIMLRAVGSEVTQPRNPAELGKHCPRCPAAHPDDPSPCDGPPVVTVLDAANAGADGCEHHGARLLASLDGGRVYALPDAPDGSAIRVCKATDTTRPFAWCEDAPRTQPSQLSRAENRHGGEPA